MEYVKSWLKTILYMDVLLLLCDNLMRRTAYEKYYRLFSGFLLVMCLIKPVIDFSSAGEFFNLSFLQNELKSELQAIGQSEDLRDMRETIREEYEASYKEQISQTALRFGIKTKEISLRWNTSENELKEIDIKGEKTDEGEEKTQVSSLRKTLMQFYNLESSHINIEVEE